MFLRKLIKMGVYAYKVTCENDYNAGEIIRTTHLNKTLFNLNRDEDMKRLFEEYGSVNLNSELLGFMEISYFGLEKALTDDSFSKFTKRVIGKMMKDLQLRDTEFYKVECL